MDCICDASGDRTEPDAAEAAEVVDVGTLAARYSRVASASASSSASEHSLGPRLNKQQFAPKGRTAGHVCGLPLAE